MNLKQRLKKVIGNFFREEEGQSTTEYILILFVVILIAMKFKNEFTTRMTKTVGSLFDKMDVITTE
ncbi:hypothetical protein K2X30_03075 [bacterium]|jgi:Flp pilus assembly pilin Flp|nr:hypothetical protein [bacterium]